VIVRSNTEEMRVRGFTTAACIWLTACIGVVCAIGAWVPILVTLALIFCYCCSAGPRKSFCIAGSIQRETSSPGKAMLAKIVHCHRLQRSEPVLGEGIAALKTVCDLDLEGIVAKRSWMPRVGSSAYASWHSRPARRSPQRTPGGPPSRLPLESLSGPLRRPSEVMLGAGLRPARSSRANNTRHASRRRVQRARLARISNLRSASADPSFFARSYQVRATAMSETNPWMPSFSSMIGS
jgi:hypothetical protein